MSPGSFVFSSKALRSLQLDEDMLERHDYKRRMASHHLLSYALKKEARERTPLRANVAPRPYVCRDVVLQNALYTGNLEALQRLFPRGSSAGLIIEPQGGEMRWVARGEGLWSLTYEQELTTPLHITAGRGFTECLKLLLQRGANVDLAPGGITALHESCVRCEPECIRLLLVHGADANAVSDDGHMPLHLCSNPESFECAKHLLQYGAAINARTADEDDTPLHVAARNGLTDHVELYLRYGASADKKNHEGLTPLNAACSQPQELKDLQRYLGLCRILMKAGADIRTMDQDRRTPLHMACKNANADLVELLLANGASVNEMDYGGEAPMHNILKVLKHCSQSPRTIEVLLNAYSQLKVTDTWVESVPPEVFEEHREFYESVFSLARTPRSLQHLSRCKLRVFLEGRLDKVVPRLDLPTIINNYLLLDYKGYIH
ncbi:ankyrin repeat and SOCS box protein 10 isoform 3-T3 [Syngnathus typhle]